MKPLKATALGAARILESAALVVSIPDFWTRYASARDHNGFPVVANDKCAARFCAAGALRAATPAVGATSAQRGLAEQTLYDVVHESYGGYFIDFNDAPGRRPIEVAMKMLAAAERLRAS